MNSTEVWAFSGPCRGPSRVWHFEPFSAEVQDPLLRTVLRRMLCFDERRRPEMREVLEMLGVKEPARAKPPESRRRLSDASTASSEGVSGLGSPARERTTALASRCGARPRAWERLWADAREREARRRDWKAPVRCRQR